MPRVRERPRICAAEAALGLACKNGIRKSRPGKAVRYVVPLHVKGVALFEESKGYFRNRRLSLTDLPLLATSLLETHSGIATSPKLRPLSWSVK